MSTDRDPFVFARATCEKMRVRERREPQAVARAVGTKSVRVRLHGGVQAAEIEAVVDPAKGLRREPQREAARHHSRPWQQWHAAEARPSSEQPHQPLRRSHERDDARYGGRTRGPERCSLAEAAHGASGAFQRAIGPGEYVLDIDEQFDRKRTSTLIRI